MRDFFSIYGAGKTIVELIKNPKPGPLLLISGAIWLADKQIERMTEEEKNEYAETSKLFLGTKYEEVKVNGDSSVSNSDLAGNTDTSQNHEILASDQSVLNSGVSEKTSGSLNQVLVSEGLAQIQGRLDTLINMAWEQELARLQEKFNNATSFLKDGIAKETMSADDYNNTALENVIKGIEQDIPLYIARGFDGEGLRKDLEKYAELMRKKFSEERRRALEDLADSTRLTEANFKGDKREIAQVEYDITMRSLYRKKAQLEKELVGTGEDKEKNRKIIDNWYAAESNQASQTLQRKNISIQRAEDSRDPARAGIEAMRRIKERTTDYASFMVDAFDRINGSMEGHFTRMLTGAESFSQGFKGIFKDMTNSILQMMIKMWYNKMIVGPLTKWWENVLGGMGFSEEQGTTSSTPVSDALGVDVYSLDLWDYLQGLAKGGPVRGGETYLVGEQGPELFTPSTMGTIIPNNRITEALSSSSSAPPVTVNVINNTGVQANARQEQAKWDGDKYILNVVLDGYTRNVNGMRDVMNQRRY